jgi:hypothetical protein
MLVESADISPNSPSSATPARERTAANIDA